MHPTPTQLHTGTRTHPTCIHHVSEDRPKMLWQVNEKHGLGGQTDPDLNTSAVT